MDVKKPIAIRSWVHALTVGATFYVYTAREAYQTTRPADTASIFKPGGLFIGDKIIAYDGVIALATTPIIWQGGGSGGGGATILDELGDVQIGTLADKQILQYDSVSGQWKNVAGSFASITGSISSEQHGDQSIAGAVTHHGWIQVAGKPSTYPPSPHATQHKESGSDELKIDELGEAGDNTNLNASISAHGLLPKLSGNASTFLNGVGGFSSPSGAGDVIGPTTHADNYIPQWDGTDTKALKEGIDPSTLEVVANKNAANGYAGLDASTKVAGTQIPYGSAANTACQGNDARLSDARTPTSHATSHENGNADEISVDGLSGTLSDPQTPTLHATSHQNGGSDEVATATPSANAIPKAEAGGTLNAGWVPAGADASAIHDNTAGEINAIATKATPVSADVLLIEDSADTFNKKKITIGTLPGGTPIFGSNYQSNSSTGDSSTTSSTPQTKCTITTPALTGTYRVAWSCEMTAPVKDKQWNVRGYNVTDAVVLGESVSLAPNNNEPHQYGGFAIITFTGAAKTLSLEYSSVDNTATVTIRRAHLDFWRVA